MNIGDLVKLKRMITSHGSYDLPEEKIAMIVETQNDAGKIRVLLSSGQKMWIHPAEVEYFPKDRRYLKE
jgi:hypothetical protein